MQNLKQEGLRQLLEEAGARMTFECQFCHKSFVREKSLTTHLCEQKHRHQQRDDAGVRLGFQSYLKFYESTQGSTKNKTYEDFAKSPYYRAFVKFGNYCVQIRAINVNQFIKWILKNNKKLDYWTSDAVYGEYLHEYLRTENVRDAIARAQEYAVEWAHEKSAAAKDVFRYGNEHTISFAIVTGRISPWVVYNCESGQRFLNEIDSKQLSLIYSSIDPDYWMKKFKDYPQEQEYATAELQKAGW